jgi:low temperature requirement protein LtrA
MVGFGAWWTYFDFAGYLDPRPEPAATLQWMFSHLPLSAAIAAMGAAMVSLAGHTHDGRPQPDRCGAGGVVPPAPGCAGERAR